MIVYASLLYFLYSGNLNFQTGKIPIRASRSIETWLEQIRFYITSYLFNLKTFKMVLKYLVELTASGNSVLININGHDHIPNQ